jgi:hypothetical protein
MTGLPSRVSFTRYSEFAHEAITVGKMHLVTLLIQYQDKELVGLDLDALAHDQMQFKNVLLVGDLRMRELKS